MRNLKESVDPFGIPTMEDVVHNIVFTHNGRMAEAEVSVNGDKHNGYEAKIVSCGYTDGDMEDISLPEDEAEGIKDIAIDRYVNEQPEGMDD